MTNEQFLMQVTVTAHDSYCPKTLDAAIELISEMDGDRTFEEWNDIFRGEWEDVGYELSKSKCCEEK